MSRPFVASAQKVKRNASVPNAGIPFGNCFLVAASIFCLRCGCNKFSVRFLIKLSKSIPSIKSSGSNTLPFDLDIF